ncbi:glutamate-cysteine ligase family protein [Couchioplanes azureus]|uniref:glutamate-cysteine ligase family protein n=1 Tax=Couchioplanes caeruleus TaxID=56438 RepID=UPI001983B6DF|nr:glutamate-cysteine ligase family protein [Couchioplanes caeruleus]GGQ46065.1 glutamate--cysteine ligase [Couchioplanes caeruleus subsp. azureus]
MGKDLSGSVFSNEDRVHYRQKVRRCLDVLALMLDRRDAPAGDRSRLLVEERPGARQRLAADEPSGRIPFDTDSRMTGLEIELNLMDADAEPAMRNAEILADLADPMFQTELGQFNLELNARPRMICGDGFADYERDLLDSLARAEERARKSDATIVLIGSLPTLKPDHLVLANLSANERYRALNDQIAGARGEQFSVDIRGVERLQTANDSIAPEAACTSVQFHMQVPPDKFAAYWNASQAVAAIQVAIGANSPYLHGRRLWAETRIALFEQATDTRPEELKAQGVRPRVWFGERWITSVFDLFEENVRYFPPLLPILDEEDPIAVLQRGQVPSLGELRLHNGTVYRWNRPVYDVMNGRPHLRVENRVLPAGPTVADMLANAAFYYGLTRQLAEEERPIWSRLPFPAAEDNFHAAARRGMETTIHWPGTGERPVSDLVRDVLLPRAHQGLAKFGVGAAHRDRLLGIIEGRCRTGRNGATWQTAAVWHAEHHKGLDRDAALHDMLLRYSAHQQTNEPVHTWPSD